MTGSSGVVISNLAYLVGAVVLAVVIGCGVWLRHRPPRSVESNMESFHRGLRALAPDERMARPAGQTARPRPAGLRIQPAHAVDPERDPEAPAEVIEDVAEAEPVLPVEAIEEGDPIAVDDVNGAEHPVGETEPDPDATAPVVNLTEQGHHQPAAGEATGDWAGVETG